MTDSLCGMVTLAPRMRSFARSSDIAPARPAALTSLGRYWQSMPSVAKAASCMPGERLRETGSPSRRTMDGSGGMGHLGKGREELRIGDGDTVGFVDPGRAGRGQAGNGQRHRDAMVTVGVDSRAAQRAGTVHADSIRALIDRCAHPAESLGHARNPGALLDSQLSRAGDGGAPFRLGR